MSNTTTSIVTKVCLACVIMSQTPADKARAEQTPAGQASKYLGNNQRAGYTEALVPNSPELLWTLIENHPPRHAWKEPNREQQFIDFDYATQVAVGSGLVVFGSSADHKVRAVSLATGQQQWSFYTEGPIRFAPVIDGDRVFVTSDDGHLYCLDLATGNQRWKFRGGPSDGKLIGNEQLISHWPARSGALVEKNRLYVTAGMWSRDGVFIYCLNPDDGSVIWKNDTSGFHYTTLPHSAGFGGVAPQGYLALNRGRLYVPTGRGAPACFDAETGEFLFYENGHGYKPHQPGGSRVMAWKGFVIFRRRSQHVEESVRYDRRVAASGAASGLYALDFRTGDPVWSLTDKNVVVGHGRHMILGGAGGVIKVDLFEVLEGYKQFWDAGKHLKIDTNIVDQKLDYTRTAPGGKLIPKPAWMTPLPYQKWEANVGQVFVMMQAGKTILAGGPGLVSAIDWSSGKVLWQHKIDGDARGICVVDGHFIVSSTAGKLYCFGEASKEGRAAIVASDRPVADGVQVSESAKKLAGRILDSSGARQGYALVLGGDGDLLCELARQSELMVYGLHEDRTQLHQAQTKLDQAGVLGVRAAVHHGKLDQLPYNPYLANLIVWGDGIGSGTSNLRAEDLHRVLRPYGGVAIQIASQESTSATRKWLVEANVAESEIRDDDLGLVVTRGPLEGAGQWTHAYANIGRTSSSEDSLAKLPLAMLWWGGPGPARIVSRHWRAPVPLFSNGVLYIQGQHDLIAVDAYNGREMWSRHLPGVGRFPPNKRGGNIVADENSVYCVIGTKCMRLDANSGKTLATFDFPVDEKIQAIIQQLVENDPRKVDETKIVWEYLGVTQDYVLGSLSYESVNADIKNPDALLSHQAKMVFAFDKSSESLLWQHTLEDAVSSLAIVADQQRMYLIDRTDERVYQRLRRRGSEQFASSIKAIELSSGDIDWQKSGIEMSRKSLTLKDDVLVAYPNPTEKEAIDSDTGVAVYSAVDGGLLWEEKDSPLLADSRRGHFNRYVFIIDDTLFLPEARDLRTGKPKPLRRNPLTGMEDSFEICGKNFCGTIAAGRDILAYRSASVGFQEVSRDSGSFWFPEIRPSCWISVVPAGGLILAPEGYSTCICPYNYKTSLALVPVERYEDWSIYLSGRQDKRANKKQLARTKQATSRQIKQLRLNLNAPGDRMDSQGNVWFAYPRSMGDSKRYEDTILPVELRGVERRFRHYADLHEVQKTDAPWLFTSGVEGPIRLSVQLSDNEQREYDITLMFAETEDFKRGDRVFEVKVQGETALSKFDIVAEAGGQDIAASRRINRVTSDSGKIQIELIPVKGQPPRVCAIIIKEAAEEE